MNGAEVTAVSSSSTSAQIKADNSLLLTNSYTDLLSSIDAVYIASHPTKHYNHVKQALLAGKHVLCESPIALSEAECNELYQLANSKNLILMDAIKTAYSTAYNRLLLLLNSGKIGQVLSVESTCTSLKNIKIDTTKKSNSLLEQYLCMGSYSYVTYLSYLRYTLDRYKYYLSYVRQNSYF